ncbi:MAG: phage terminase small subunit-related protein [Candidatus Gastranaerophilales bacterium]|nr:phage terminase small subunit-related protein [Candidatus Gastranaerophilales bacterium]
MNSKEYLANEAERLYVYDCNTVDEIAEKINISSKTVCRWKDKYNWDSKKKSYLRTRQCFHEELYEFARKLMKDISSDMDSGEKIDPGRMYAFCRIIPMFTKVKDYEDIVAKKEKKETQKGLTPELIAQIEEEVLGITQNNDNEKE